MLTTRVLSYRKIDPVADANFAVVHRRAACIATYGDDARFEGPVSYLRWLRNKVEEFPDGFVMASQGGKCVGQLELEVPYGLSVGYINLFYVRRRFRRQGIGRQMHEYAERYFRSWQATEVALHASPANRTAIAFYQSFGNQFDGVEPSPSGLWRMNKRLTANA